MLRKKYVKMKKTKSSLSERISQLNSEKSRLMTQRSDLHEERGKMKEVIAFLLDAQSYWKWFSTTTESCIANTALVGEYCED